MLLLSRCCRSNEEPWPIGENAHVYETPITQMPQNRISPNFDVRIVVIPVVLVFLEFLLVSAQRHFEGGGV